MSDKEPTRKQINDLTFNLENRLDQSIKLSQVLPDSFIDNGIKDTNRKLKKQLVQLSKKYISKNKSNQINYYRNCEAYTYFGYLIAQKIKAVSSNSKLCDYLNFNFDADNPNKIHETVKDRLSKYQINIMPKSKIHQHKVLNTIQVRKNQKAVLDNKEHKLMLNCINAVRRYYTSNDSLGNIRVEYHIKQNKYTKQGQHNIEAHPSLQLRANSINGSYIYQLLCNPTIINKYNQKYHTNHKIGELRNTKHSVPALPGSNTFNRVVKFLGRDYKQNHK